MTDVITIVSDATLDIINLSGLADVSVTEGPAIDGYSLVFDNASGKWVARSVSTAPPPDVDITALSGLDDVNVTEGTAIDGYSLVFDNASGKWIARNMNQAPDVDITALSGLNDVNVTEGSAIDGYHLVFDNATSKWVARALAPDVDITTLNGLADVNVSEGAGINGLPLVWDNPTSKWVARALASGSTALNALTDVNVTEGSAIDGYSLVFDNVSGKWVARSITGGTGNRITVYVEDFTAGGADDTVRLQNAFNWLGAAANRGLAFTEGKVYSIGSTLTMNGANNFRIFGNGATIKAKNGMSAAAGTQMVLMTNCVNGKVIDLFTDANRANRTPAETTNHSIQVYTGCSGIDFIGVRSDNAVCDGFYLNSATPTVLASVPTDIRFMACRANNAFRNDMSVINSNRFRDFSGLYTGATGTLPMSGIDFEPNSATEVGNIDARCYGTVCDNNAGHGFNAVWGNTSVMFRNCSASNNTLGAITTLSGAYIDVDGFYASTYGAGMTRGVIDIGDSSVAARLKNLSFNNVTSGSDVKPLIYIHVNTTGPFTIDGVFAKGCNCAVLNSSQRVKAQNIHVEGANVGYVLYLQNSAAKSRIHGVYSSGVLALGYINVADVELNDVSVLNPTTTGVVTMFDTSAVRPVVRNYNLLQDTAIPAGEVGLRFNAVPRFVDGVMIACNGTDFTTANGIVYNAGTTGATIGTHRP